MDENISAAALIAGTRAALLNTQYTAASLQKFERVWRELERYINERAVPSFTREVGLAFLVHRYGMVMRNAPQDRLSQDRLRAIEVLEDFQAHLPLAIRRRRPSSLFIGPWQPLMEAFMEFEKHAGRSARTMDSHVLYLDRFAQFLHAAGITDPAALSAPVLMEFVSQTGHQYSLSTLYCTSCLVRGFLRYLHRQGHTGQDLSGFIPPVSGTKKAHVPSAYATEDIARLLEAVDRANPKGRRDYAMILLASRLGLRASDICRLTFENFRWETNTLVITQQKTGEPLTLPLLTEVGTAVIEYIKYGRPTLATPIVFLRHTAPVGPLTAPTLHSIVSQYLTRAGVSIPAGKKRGPHALRHSLASALLREQTPLPIISAVLGHRDSTSTGTYLTIDLTQLRTLALEVPPVRAGSGGNAR